MASRLIVLFNGRKAGSLERMRFGSEQRPVFRFRYLPEYLESSDACPIGFVFPLSHEPYDSRDNLLGLTERFAKRLIEAIVQNMQSLISIATEMALFETERLKRFQNEVEDRCRKIQTTLEPPSG